MFMQRMIVLLLLTQGLGSATSAITSPEKTQEKFCPMGSRVPAANTTFIDALFRRLATDQSFAYLSPRVMSSPDIDKGKPWVLVLDDFMSKGEAAAMVTAMQSGTPPPLLDTRTHTHTHSATFCKR